MKSRSRVLTLVVAGVTASGVALAPGIAAAATATCNPTDPYAMCLSAQPTAGPRGAQVTVRGTGWVNWAESGIDVPISFDFTPQGQFLADPVPNQDGTFAVTIRVPGDAPVGDTRIDALTGSGTSVRTPFTVSAGSPPSKGCPTVLLGLHGFGEGPSDTKAADPESTVEKTWTSFTERAGELHVSKDFEFLDVPYKTAEWTLFNQTVFNPITMRTLTGDVTDGSNALEAETQAFTALCPSTTFTLVGYSEGAWVVNYWLHFHPKEARSQVKAVELYGDPIWYRAYDHDPNGGVVAYQGLARIAGLDFGWFGPPYPIQNTPYLVQSLCASNDPVCGEGYKDTIADHRGQFETTVACVSDMTCTHHSYTSGATKQGGEFLANHAF